MTGFPLRASLCIAMAAVSGLATAAPRPDVTKMSCEQAQALIRDAGAIVVTTGRHTYSRIVAREGYCDAGERFLHRAYAPTADAKSCFVGYTCQSWDPYFLDD